MEYKGLTLDKFQEDAIARVKRNHSVVVSAPTGCGKTVIADFIIEKELEGTNRVIYTAPIKALSNQKYRDFSNEYGKDKIGLMTGDEVINPGAQIVIMTTEIYRNMCLVQDSSIQNIAYVIFDEIHYINDVERGYVWEESIIFSPDTVRFLCLSATIPNSKEFASWIRSIKKHQVDVVLETHRPVPLNTDFYQEDLGLTDLKHIKNMKKTVPYEKVFRKKGGRRTPRWKRPSHLHLVQTLGEGKMPMLFFCFSRATTQKYAEELARKSNKTDMDIISFINKKLGEAPKEISQLKTTMLLRDTLPKGIAFHHAGLIPVLKEIVESLFTQGKIDVLYVTETFAVGINMPAKTVCFDDLRKFNGVSFGFMTSKEYFQMAGRAGRRGMDKVGFVIPMIDYRNFDYQKIQYITSKDVEPLKSQFRLSINTVLNLIKDHTAQETDAILEQSFFAYQKGNPKQVKLTFKNLVKKLTKLEYITLENKLTWKGAFASRMFVDEIMFTEIFATDVWKTLTSYEITLVIAAMVYEERRGDDFYENRGTIVENKLFGTMKNIMRKRAHNIDNMSSIIYPIFNKKTFFEMLKNSNKDEGDLMRIFSQVLDRFQQLMRASQDKELTDRLRASFNQVKDFVKDIY